jgi:hypothetical protein
LRIQCFLVALTAVSLTAIGQKSAFSILSPSQRLATFTATTYLPNRFLAIGTVNPNLSLNFSAGQLLNGDPSANIRNLVQSRLYLGLESEVDVEVLSILWKNKKGGRTALGLNAGSIVQVSLDRDFLRIATEGILPDGFGEEVINSKGISANAHLYSEIYLHKVRSFGRSNFGYRVRLVSPIAGAQVSTPELELRRINSGSVNEIALNYEFTTAFYGVDPNNINSFAPSPSMLFSKNTSFLFDLGIEQELNPKLKVGLSVQNIPGQVRVSGIESTSYSGSISYSGPQFILGQDSLSSVFGELVQFNIDSLLPKVTTNADASIQIPFKPVVRLYAHRYLGEDGILALSATIRPSAYGNDLRTSAYVYSRSNKLFHLAYGLNWWTNNNSFDATIAGRILLAPYTRLTIGMSNPFLLPRIGEGSVFLPENFTGFSLSAGISIGFYRNESL